MPNIRWHRGRLIRLALITAVCLLLVYAADLLRNQVKMMVCSDEESKALLQELCDLYEAGELAGNLCADLCDHRTIKYMKCFNYREGKKIFMSQWNGKTVILKSKKGHFSDYHPLIYFRGSNENLAIMSESEFEKMVRDSVKFNLGLATSDKEDILTKLWSSNFHSFISGSSLKMQRAAMNSLWSLIQQDEYLLQVSLRHSKHFPKMYGTCGHFYVIEYVPPGNVLEESLTQPRSSWNERAEVSLAVLELVRSFEEDFREPLHLCDVKGDNFGLDENKVVKAIDTDMSFFTSKLGNEFVSTPNCSDHSDCDFFDCKGWCFIPQKRCLGKRINNNLQVVCEKIFLANMENVWEGTLRLPPNEVKSELQHLLQECANPGNAHNNMRYKAPWALLYKLQKVLKNSVTSGHPKSF